MTEDQLRDKDRIILTAVSNGNDDVQKITAQTTLENHHVTYAFQKLEELDLVQVDKPDGYVQRQINGQKRVFQHPKQAELTEQGRQILEQQNQEDLEKYENLTHQELVEKIHSLEKQVGELENKLQVFQKQVQNSIE